MLTLNRAAASKRDHFLRRTIETAYAQESA